MDSRSKSSEVGGQNRRAGTPCGSSARLITHPALRNMLFLSLVPHLRVAEGKNSLSQALLKEKQDPDSFSAVPRNGREGSLNETRTLPITKYFTSVTPFFPGSKAISVTNHTQPLLGM